MAHNRLRNRISRSARMESLETRDLLSGGALAALPVAASAAAGAGQNTGVALTTPLTSSAVGGAATGGAQFNQGTVNGVATTTFGVQVKGASVDDTFTVTVGGVDVGQFTTDNNGNGGLVLSSSPTGTQTALPANFPTTVAAGTAVSLSDTTGAITLTGSLAVGAGTPPAPPPPAPPVSSGSGTVLTAQLAGSTASVTATGSAQYNQGTVNGTAMTTFGVQVHGATPDDTFTVTLAGVDIGTFTTDANGNGGLVVSSSPTGSQLALPANFPTTVASGASITLTDTSGSTTLGGSLGSPKAPPAPPPPPVPTGPMLTAQLTSTSSTAIGLVQYNQTTVPSKTAGSSSSTTTLTTFVVQIQGATADDTFSVSIAGTVVGTITTDSKGNGCLFLSSNPANATQTALPANFPTSLAAGAEISVTDTSGAATLSGALAKAAPPPTTGSGSSGSTPVANGTTLTAQLSDTVNTSDTAIGAVQLNQAAQNNQTNTMFVAQVHGAAANDTLSVAIGSVVVGSFTTDANGNGCLVLSSHPQSASQTLLPANFPTSITAGTEITVSDSAGTTTLAGLLATGATTPWHNPTNPLDVVGKGGAVGPVDALAVIQYLNSGALATLSTGSSTTSEYLDVSGNNTVSPNDALVIIRYLNTSSSGSQSQSSPSVQTSSASQGAVSPSTPAAATSTTGTATSFAAAAGSSASNGASSSGATCVPAATIAANLTSSGPVGSPSAGSGAGASSSTAAVKPLSLSVFSSPASVDAALSDPSFDWTA